jgi:hypothetical protein
MSIRATAVWVVHRGMVLLRLLVLVNIAGGFSLRSDGRICWSLRQPLRPSSSIFNHLTASVTKRRRVVYPFASDVSDDESSLSPTNLPTIPTPSIEILAASTGIATLTSVQKAVDLIELSGDRRYLHAVVANGYNHFMYRGIPTDESHFPSIRTEPCDLLDPATYDSAAAAEFFLGLDSAMQNQPIRPSNGHIAVTSPSSAAVWGGAAALIWPLGQNVHYSWLPERNEFWPGSTSNTTKLFADRQADVIVDGVNCESMSLEDALKRDAWEIMFRADRFLAVPLPFKSQIVSQLKRSFIV